MKKLVFVGISLLFTEIYVDEVRGDVARNRRGTTRAAVNRQRLRAQNSTITKNAKNIRKTNSTTSIKYENVNSPLSMIRLESSVYETLKGIVEKVSSEDIRALVSNMAILYRNLPKKSGSEDVNTLVDKINKASSCFDELLRVKSNLCQELFNQREKVTNLSDNVELDRIMENLNQVDLNKLSRVISACQKEQLSTRIINNLRVFGNRIKESKTILEEMKQKFSPVVLSQIEGIPELKNLESANTMSNRKLANYRDQESYDSADDETDDDPLFVDENIDIEKPLQEEEFKISGKIEEESKYGKDQIAGKFLDTLKSSTSKKKPSQEEESEISGKIEEESKYGKDQIAGKFLDVLKSSTSKKKPLQEEESEISEKIEEESEYGKDQIAGKFLDVLKSSTSKKKPLQEEESEISEKIEEESEYGKDQIAGKFLDTLKSSTSRKNTKNENLQGEVGNKLSETEGNTEEMQKYEDTSEVSDLNKTENLEEFYKSLEENISLLNEEKLESKQKTARNKVGSYLKEAKSERSFEQKVSDIGRVIKAYNSLVSLNPKKKDGKSLLPVQRDKIKDLRETIYLKVFNDLTSRIEKLESDKRFDGLDIQNDFDNFVKTNEQNKKDFEKSTSGEDKRKLMTNSAEEYDKLMEKIWKEPELIKTKRDQAEFDRVGYTLDPVILSIDVTQNNSDSFRR